MYLNSCKAKYVLENNFLYVSSETVYKFYAVTIMGFRKEKVKHVYS